MSCFPLVKVTPGVHSSDPILGTTNSFALFDAMDVMLQVLITRSRVSEGVLNVQSLPQHTRVHVQCLSRAHHQCIIGHCCYSSLLFVMVIIFIICSSSYVVDGWRLEMMTTLSSYSYHIYLLLAS